MAQRSLRFAIRDDHGRRAATWKLWTEAAGGRSEVYLASRSLGRYLKVSLHESGDWHFAYEQRAFEARVQGTSPSATDRFIRKWKRPAELAPGLTLAFRVNTPASAVTTPIEAGLPAGLIWVPNAPEGMATEIDIFLVKNTTRSTSWPGKTKMGTSLVGSVPLENGETVWVVYWVVPMPDFSKAFTGGRGSYYKGVSEKHLHGANLKALVFGEEADGSRVFYDVPVQVSRSPATEPKGA